MSDRVLVLIHKGAKVTDLETKREFISKAEFTGNYIQEKLGFIYYEANNKQYRAKWDQCYISIPTKTVTAA